MSWAWVKCGCPGDCDHRDGSLEAFSPRNLLRAARVLRDLFPGGERAGFPALELEVFALLTDTSRYDDLHLVLTDDQRDLWEAELEQVLSLARGELYLTPQAQGEWPTFWERLDEPLEEVLEDGLRLVRASRQSGQPIHVDRS